MGSVRKGRQIFFGGAEIPTKLANAAVLNVVRCRNTQMSANFSENANPQKSAKGRKFF